MSTEYRVRVKRFGVPDKFYAKKDVGKVIKMIQEWEAERDGRLKHTLDGTAVLAVESRQVSKWRAVVRGDVGDEEATVLLGKGDYQE